MRKIMSKIFKLLCIPRSLYYNLKLFPIKTAIRIPILISNKIKVAEAYRGAVEINSAIRPFMIYIGFEGTIDICENRYGLIMFDKGSKIIFNGKASMAKGVFLRVSKGAKLIIGENFTANKNCHIGCAESVYIGKDVLLGFNVNITDNDGHWIYNLDKPQQLQPLSKPITIGNNVWMGAYVDIRKGVNIPNGCVVGWRSCVFKSFTEESCIIGGYPAKVIRNNVGWKR